MSGTRQRRGEGIAVRERAVADALPALSHQLSSEEERVLRLLHGAAAPADLALERKASGAALESLYRLEAELHRRHAEHLQRPVPQASDTKDRIVRALRRKR